MASVSVTITIESNDGQTTLASQVVSTSEASPTLKVNVTSTGATYTLNGNTGALYTYSGTEGFLGLATSSGATTPTYVVGTSTPEVTPASGATYRYYIVEAPPVNYRPLSYTDAKIQVDSAIRDGLGRKIDTNYALKSEVYTALSTKADTSTLTNYVDKSSNQTGIAGNKEWTGLHTFGNTITVKNTFPQAYLDNTSDNIATAYTGVDTKYYIAMRDVNDAVSFHISNYVYNGGRGLSISSFDKSSGSIKEANIGLITPTSSAPYVTATYRAYNASNVTDVMTIGMYNTLTTGTGTVATGCSLIDGVTIKWYRKGNICTVTFPIKASASYTGVYTQYILATGLPASVIDDYPFGSSLVSIDGQDNSGGARAFVNSYGHLYVLVRNQSIAEKGLVGSVTYITA